MTSTYGASPILKRNKQPLAASTWGRNLTPSLLLHLFSKNEMFHLLCSQAPLILLKITSRSHWLCQCLISGDYLSTCNILLLSLFSEFSDARWSLLNWERSRYHSPLFPSGEGDLWRRRGALHNNVNNSPLSSVQKYCADPTSCLSALSQYAAAPGPLTDGHL